MYNFHYRIECLDIGEHKETQIYQFFQLVEDLKGLEILVIHYPVGTVRKIADYLRKAVAVVHRLIAQPVTVEYRPADIVGIFADIRRIAVELGNAQSCAVRTAAGIPDYHR